MIYLWHDLSAQTGANERPVSICMADEAPGCVVRFREVEADHAVIVHRLNWVKPPVCLWSRYRVGQDARPTQGSSVWVDQKMLDMPSHSYEEIRGIAIDDPIEGATRWPLR